MEPPLILEVRGLRKHFPVAQALTETLTRKPQRFAKAVDGVSFSLKRGEVLALVGESGCGKTTIARTLIGLEKPTSGEILFKDKRVGGSGGRTAAAGKPGTASTFPLKELRRHAQMVFQDPYESLNPRATISEIVAEPLVVHQIAPQPEERFALVRAALEDAGLRPAEDYLLRYPHELSGGQRQRVVIASAMVLQPELLIADEPVSMLDVSIRAEILNLLRDLRQQRGISILFITHDLSTVAYFADRLAVMYLGRIVETGPTAEVLASPGHPYTRALISVIPAPNPRQRRERLILQGETPNPVDIPLGCRFHPRCPVAIPICQRVDPPEVHVSAAHRAACHLLT